ncbi:MAG: T9SS type A sorting domain-containing protein [Flavisolibacter sp.]|nr:T9SS type A sorting domain-containing protein [Flavisolibacter sp.]
MKLTLRLTGILFFVFTTVIVSAQEKWSKVKIPITSEKIKSFVFENLELDHFTYEENAMVVVLDQTEIQRLRSAGIPFQVTIDDMVKYTLQLNKQGARLSDQPTDAARAAFQVSCKQVATIIQRPASFTPGSLKLGGAGDGYYTYTEMNTKMQELANAYPNLVSLFSIGTSAEGRTIYGVKISDSVATDEAEPEVLYTGLQHAREAISGTSLIFFMQYLAENYGTDAKVQSLVNNREIFIIPCMNPDGYEYNYRPGVNPQGGGLWRKSRRQITNTAYGVDLNRNYSVDWGNCSGATTSCGSSDPTQDTYYGPSAFSEPETRALRDFVYSRNFVTAIDQHCYGPYYSLPFGRPSLHTMSASDNNFYSYTSALMGLYDCHRAGNSPQTVGYEVAGGIKDWLLLGDIGVGSKGKVFGMTGEAGGGDFWAPTAQIQQLCKELCYQNLQLAFTAGDYYDLQDKTDVSLTTTTGSFGFFLRRIGLTNNPVTVSLVPLENIQTAGTPVTTTLANYYDTYNGIISYTLAAGITNGQRVRFAWKVESGGVVTYDTVTKIYNPVTLLYDNMEGTLTTNWTATTTVKRGETWTFTNLSAYAGTKSMTESASGNYATNSNCTVAYNGSFNLSDASAAYLSFWVKHRAENCNDKLQIQVSKDGVTYTPVCGINTVSENNGTLAGQPALTGIRENWTRELFDLSSFKGSSAVKLRFQFTSDGDAGSFYKEVDDGFYIDEVKVIKTVAPLAGARTSGYLNLYGQMLPDQSVQLEWEANTDSRRQYFEVERLTEGNEFVSIGKGNEFPPYQFIDNAPATGTNYYRIKQVYKDGTVSYSKIINFNIQNTFSLAIYPNPVHDVLSIKWNQQQPASIQITNTEGRLVFQKQITGTTSGSLNIDVKNWKPQLYIIRIVNSKNETLIVQKVMKL